MAIKSKNFKVAKYSRAKATKIAAYVVLILCICLVSNLLSEFIYTYNSDLESVFKEQYYNSNTYYNEVGRALYDISELLLRKELASLPVREYYYEAYGYGKGYGHRNFELGQKSSFSGYLYEWRHGEIYALRLDVGGMVQALPWEESGIVSFLEGQMANFRLEDVGYPNSVQVIFTDELLAQRQQAWEAERAALLDIGEQLLAVLLIIVPLILYLGLVTGRRPEDEALHPGMLDRLYSDVLLLLLLAVALGGGAFWLVFVEGVRNSLYYGNQSMPQETRRLLAVGSVVYVGALVGLVLLLFNALIRKIKAHCFLKHSLVYTLFCFSTRPVRHVGRGLRGLFGKTGEWCGNAWLLLFVGPEYGGSDPAERLFRRQRRFLLITAGAVVLMIFFLLFDIVPLFLLTLLAEIAFIYYFLRDNRRDISEVRMSVENSLTEQMKSQKLKVDLVTNVSHDLKTPLTSIISYVELLALEDDLSPAARDYVQVLGEKSHRLNRIVSDLFELAKATSGNIPLEIELLDLKRLFAQTLADMGDSIEASGMQMRLHLPEQPLLVLADGDKLYRVLQNVLDNALKYSLAGSRVYVELWESSGRAIGVVKNTAAYEMNFTAEDILRRFSRGDAARSSEGSGLGLAIAKSFCEICGGRFSVIIDGDQFKVMIEFPLAGKE